MAATSYIKGDIFILVPKKQTLKAWHPYEDCREILFQFQNSDVDDEHPEWRLYWVAGIALLRTVGHVLAKADASCSPQHALAIEHFWVSLKQRRSQNRIFWDFIDAERNNLLKTYTFGAELVEDAQGCSVRYSNGEDAMELFREAVYWWRHHLIALEKVLPKAGTG